MTSLLPKSKEEFLQFAFQVGVLFAGWSAAWLVLDATMLPSGVGFALLILYLCAKLFGKLVPMLSSRLPPLLGMLLVGLVLRNLPGEPLRADALLLGYDFDWWSVKLRTFALSVIMLRAGLALDLQKLLALGGPTARLAVCPCFAEAVTVTFLAVVLLDFPIEWGGTLGFVIAAVSPAVVVPGMLDLKSRGYGTKKGVPTMVVAAASFDDVLAIAGFGICLAFAESHESGADSNGGLAIAWLVAKAPVELITGVITGAVFGVLIAGSKATHSFSDTWHFVAALTGVLITVFGGKKTNFSGGGALGALVVGATVAQMWEAKKLKQVQGRVNELWTHVQPALFGLLGAAVKLDALKGSEILAALGILAGGLTVRIAVTRLAMMRSSLNAAEARLVCLAWIPKATVQAAVGGTALDLMQERALGPVAEQRGNLVLMVSVLVILLTAPVGAICISTFGPMWLSHDVEESCDPETLPTSTSQAIASGTVGEEKNGIADPAPAEEQQEMDPASLKQTQVDIEKADVVVAATVCQARVQEQSLDTGKIVKQTL